MNIRSDNSVQLLKRMLAKLRLHHSQAIVHLCDLKQMGRAAEAMNMTQPAMSQLVGDLENLLGPPCPSVTSEVSSPR